VKQESIQKERCLKQKLTIDLLCYEAEKFSEMESNHKEASLFGVTDGKAIGTYLEHKLKAYLNEKYFYVQGNSAKGIDFPELLVDIKVTSSRQPQSSCPFKSARQKIFGLGYSLLVFVYDKIDDDASHTGKLDIIHTIFVSAERTADFQTTSGIVKIIENEGNKDDLLAFLLERMLPVDEIEAIRIAEEFQKSAISRYQMLCNGGFSMAELLKKLMKYLESQE
jgi:hypothetical protein